MKILFTICGRAGSKGIKNKNLINFIGYPLSFYSVSAIDLYLKKHPEIEGEIVLNTDSQQLVDMFKKCLNINVEIIERNPDLGLDFTPKLAVISNSYKIMISRFNKDYDMVVDLDITSPLRTVKDIDNLVNKKLASNADVVFSVTEARRNPYFNMVKQNMDGYYTRVIESEFNARQEAPEIFDMNASLYAYSPSFLKDKKSIFQSKCDVIEMMDTGVLDIDSQQDFEIMEVLASYFFKKYDEYSSIREHIYSLLSVRKS